MTPPLAPNGWFLSEVRLAEGFPDDSGAGVESSKDIGAIEACSRCCTVKRAIGGAAVGMMDERKFVLRPDSLLD